MLVIKLIIVAAAALVIGMVISILEKIEGAAASRSISEKVVRIFILTCSMCILLDLPIIMYMTSMLLVSFIYIQAYFDVKERLVCKEVSDIANILLWLTYIWSGTEGEDIAGILGFCAINILMGRVLKLYGIGDMRILFAITPVMAMRFSGDELMFRLLFLLLLSDVIFVVIKVYDSLVHKTGLGEPKEFVPSILVGTLVVMI